MYKIDFGFSSTPLFTDNEWSKKKDKRGKINLNRQARPLKKDTVYFQGKSEKSLLDAAQSESISLASFSHLLSQAIPNVNWQDDRGNTALIKASHNPEKVKLLLENGADPRISNHFGDTPLMKAAQAGNLNSVHLLVETLKAQNNDFTKVFNKEYNTALHLAASRGHIEVTEHLVTQGFSPALQNLDKESPMTLARANGHQKTAEILKALAAKHSMIQTDQPVSRLFSEVIISKQDKSETTTLVKPDQYTATPIATSIQPTIFASEQEPLLSPYQVLLNSFMQGGSLLQEDPKTVKQILTDAEIFEEFALRLTEDMARSTQTKAEIEQGLCHQYFLSSGTLQRFWHRMTQAVTDRIPLELAQNYPDTQKMLSIVLPEYKQTDNKPKLFGFNSVAGMDKLKGYLKKHVIKPLQGVEDDEFDVPKPNGILFFGPSRTGKSHLAKALAQELDMNCKKISGADIFSSYQGQSITNTKALFDEARALAKEKPTILIIDEINQIVPNRRTISTNNADMPRIVDQFLIELDNASRDGIFTIGTSNLPTSIDNAVMQPGRLDKCIPIGLPDQDAREKLFQFYIEEKAKKAVRFQSSVYEDLAKLTTDLSAADIKQVVADAIHSYIDHKAEKPINRKPLIDFLMHAAKSVQPANSEKEVQAFKQYVLERRLTDATEL